MSESASSTQHAGSNNAEQQGAQKASFELPEENTKTALKQNDRTHVVDLVTGQTVTEPIARNRQTDNLVIVCVDPNKKHGQAEVRVHVTCLKDAFAKQHQQMNTGSYQSSKTFGKAWRLSHIHDSSPITSVSKCRASIKMDGTARQV